MARTDGRAVATGVAAPVHTLVVPRSPDRKSTDAVLLAEIRRLTVVADRKAGISAGAFPLAAAGRRHTWASVDSPVRVSAR